jgi:uncharacterized protein
MNNKTIVACPTCHKSQQWDIKNLYRPFCSERCKLIDLGEWADESRKIPGKPIDDSQESE